MSDDFPFPFEPYDVQSKYMKVLYDTLQSGDVSILESPTGTGKTLSIICSAVKWLKDHEDDVFEEEDATTGNDTADNDDDDAYSWITQHHANKKRSERERKLNELRQKRQQLRKHLDELREKQKRERATVGGGRARKQKRSVREEQPRNGDDDEDSAVLSDYDDGEDGGGDSIGLDRRRASAAAAARTSAVALGDRARKLLASIEKEESELAGAHRARLDDARERAAVARGEQQFEERKLFYCSRTHSQLAQFVQEIKRTVYGERLKVVSLGSRKLLCVHSGVRALGDAAQMNDRCLEMQQSSGGGGSKVPKKHEAERAPAKAAAPPSSCPYLQSDELRAETRDRLLATVSDIEETATVGERNESCPYYAARDAVRFAEVVALPYSMLLHRQTRESLGLHLRDNVVVIDECHNVIDAINEVHSVSITAWQLVCAQSLLAQYHDKYKKRLNAGNEKYILQILAVCKCLIRHLFSGGDSAAESKTAREQQQLLTQNEFVFACKIDHFDLFEIERYFEQSRVVKKVFSFARQSVVAVLAEFAAHAPDKGSEQALDIDPQRARHSLQALRSFLAALTHAEADGRVLTRREGGDARRATWSYRFLLINPETHFHEVLREARAVVLTGGTVHPLSAFVDQLFGFDAVRAPPPPSLSSSSSSSATPAPTAAELAIDGVDKRLVTFSCGHIVDAERVAVLPLCSGPLGDSVPFEFTFAKRNDAQMVLSLGRALCNISALVPGGIVLFFPSYSYEQQVFDAWAKSGVLADLQRRRTVFREPRGSGSGRRATMTNGSAVAAEAPLLERYAGAIERGEPALLSAVVGGKMSEGINFCDDLARCVFMVGLPFPNIYDPVLREKRDRLPAQAQHSFLNNLCFKAVNQSIGRSIRHANDYAVIVLADCRYAKASQYAMLPGWLQRSIHKNATTFPSAIKVISAFFKHRRESIS